MPPMVKLIAFLLLFVLTSSAEASVAFVTRGVVTPADIAATRTYLRAQHHYEQAIKGTGPLM